MLVFLCYHVDFTFIWDKRGRSQELQTQLASHSTRPFSSRKKHHQHQGQTPVSRKPTVLPSPLTASCPAGKRQHHEHEQLKEFRSYLSIRAIVNQLDAGSNSHRAHGSFSPLLHSRQAQSPACTHLPGEQRHFHTHKHPNDRRSPINSLPPTRTFPQIASDVTCSLLQVIFPRNTCSTA